MSAISIPANPGRSRRSAIVNRAAARRSFGRACNARPNASRAPAQSFAATRFSPASIAARYSPSRDAVSTFSGPAFGSDNACG